LTRSGNTDAYGGSPVYTGIDVSVLPAGPEILAVYGGQQSFALYEIWTGKHFTLKNGDKLISGSCSWIVRGVPQVVDNQHLFYVRVIGEEVV
jgi:hypothetical protein